MGRLIFEILFESKLIQTLMEVRMTKEVEFEIGINFNGRNLKNMSLITTVVDPSEELDKTTVGTRRIPMDNYPVFFKEDPIEVLEFYITDCLATGITPVAFSHEKLPDDPTDVYPFKRKRNPKSYSDGPSRTVTPTHQPTKVARTYNIQRDTMGQKKNLSFLGMLELLKHPLLLELMLSLI